MNVKSASQQWTKLIQELQRDELLPVVVFSFSKRLCVQTAFSLGKAVDLTTPSEKSAIHSFVEQSVNRLQGTDRLLPQVLALRSLLSRGIGVHHGGLLPIMKVCLRLTFGKRT